MQQLVIFLIVIAIALSEEAHSTVDVPPCVSFVPSTSEIEEVIVSTDSPIPEGATLQSACHWSFLELEGSTTLTEVITYNFNFIWPADRKIDDLSFYRRGVCIREGNKSSRCFDTGAMARIGESEPFDYSESIDDHELKELIDQAQNVFPNDAQISRVRKLTVRYEGVRTGEEHIYVVSIRSRDGQISFNAVKECDIQGHCRWHFTNG